MSKTDSGEIRINGGTLKISLVLVVGMLLAAASTGGAMIWGNHSAVVELQRKEAVHDQRYKEIVRRLDEIRDEVRKNRRP